MTTPDRADGRRDRWLFLGSGLLLILALLVGLGRDRWLRLRRLGRRASLA